MIHNRYRGGRGGRGERGKGGGGEGGRGKGGGGGDISHPWTWNQSHAYVL